MKLKAFAVLLVVAGLSAGSMFAISKSLRAPPPPKAPVTVSVPAPKAAAPAPVVAPAPAVKPEAKPTQAVVKPGKKKHCGPKCRARKAAKK